MTPKYKAYKFKLLYICIAYIHIKTMTTKDLYR